MKKALFLLLSTIVFTSTAQELYLWGVDVSQNHPEITNCRVNELKDNTIFAKVKMSYDSYTFANDKPNYSCWYGEESACFEKATQYISSLAGKPFDVYVYDKHNSYSLKPSFFNIWQFTNNKKYYSLMLFGSGEGMTLDVSLFPNDKSVRTYILNTVRSFHFAITPKLQKQLEE